MCEAVRHRVGGSIPRPRAENLCTPCLLRRAVRRNLAAPIPPQGVSLRKIFKFSSFLLLLFFFLCSGGWKLASEAKIWAQMGQNLRLSGTKFTSIWNKIYVYLEQNLRFFLEHVLISCPKSGKKPIKQPMKNLPDFPWA